MSLASIEFSKEINWDLNLHERSVVSKSVKGLSIASGFIVPPLTGLVEGGAVLSYLFHSISAKSKIKTETDRCLRESKKMEKVAFLIEELLTYPEILDSNDAASHEKEIRTIIELTSNINNYEKLKGLKLKSAYERLFKNFYAGFKTDITSFEILISDSKKELLNRIEALKEIFFEIKEKVSRIQKDVEVKRSNTFRVITNLEKRLINLRRRLKEWNEAQTASSNEKVKLEPKPSIKKIDLNLTLPGQQISLRELEKSLAACENEADTIAVGIKESIKKAYAFNLELQNNLADSSKKIEKLIAEVTAHSKIYVERTKVQIRAHHLKLEAILLRAKVIQEIYNFRFDLDAVKNRGKHALGCLSFFGSYILGIREIAKNARKIKEVEPQTLPEIEIGSTESERKSSEEDFYSLGESKDSEMS